MKLDEVAVIFGGTGLTGKHLVSLILGDPKFSEIIIVSRNKINLNHKKITNKIINFSKYEEIESSILKNSIVFSCIGTTMHQVNGNEKKYKSIDLDITVNIAKASKKVGAKKFLFISTARANSLSKNFYLKLKGDIENTVIDCNFKSVFIFRPSLLLGKRKEKRPIEKIVQIIMSYLSFLFPNSIKAINASDVAKHMIHIAKSNLSGINIISNKDIINHCKY
ncbi:MAG: semialdehyde dehydrogenase [Flavobacteriales bacterium]|nr:semialdehyde dehydrogenase [Flavobacteriales bacterium]